MKIIRYVNPEGKINYGSEEPDGSRQRIEGGIFDSFSVTKEPVRVAELLAPVAPVAMWCIGQNYRQHADEVGFTVPDFPVVFAKRVNALQSPGGPVFLPTDEYSTEVDYEGELVVIIGKACKNVSRDRVLITSQATPAATISVHETGSSSGEAPNSAAGKVLTRSRRLAYVWLHPRARRTQLDSAFKLC